MDATDTFADLVAACQERSPRVALVLGSGMGPVVDHWGRLRSVEFGDVPGLPPSGVHGHRGRLSLVEVASVVVLVFEGRLHFYEGHPWEVVTRPTRVAFDLGARTMLHTNAAGGIRDDLSPGCLMAIADHWQLTTPACCRQPGPGNRPSPYSPQLLEKLRVAARRAGVILPQGVYASLTGPCYETRAEIRALKQWGADAVGMSTAREVQAGFDLGMGCAAVSCITNRACGLSDTPLTHAEVLAVGEKAAERMLSLVESFLRES